jgi:sugar lactone lactonase YvrE
VILLDGVGFPEAPRWRDGRLWFSDLQRRRVSYVDEAGVTEVASVAGTPSGLGWDPAGNLLVVSMWDGQLIRCDGTSVADLTTLAPPPWNDMVVDPLGRAYVGNVGFDFIRGEAPKPTVLALVEVDGSVRVAADDVMGPNGAVLVGETLILAETPRCRLTAFSVRPDGSLGDRRVWADLGDQRPDGIALDPDGGCWVACIGSPEVIRVAEGGAVTARVVVSQPAVACAVGDGDLYVCTAPGSSRDQVDRLAGRIERLDV